MEDWERWCQNDSSRVPFGWGRVFVFRSLSFFFSILMKRMEGSTDPWVWNDGSEEKRMNGMKISSCSGGPIEADPMMKRSSLSGLLAPFLFPFPSRGQIH